LIDFRADVATLPFLLALLWASLALAALIAFARLSNRRRLLHRIRAEWDCPLEITCD
jgi:hypothetical protein